MVDGQGVASGGTQLSDAHKSPRSPFPSDRCLILIVDITEHEFLLLDVPLSELSDLNLLQTVVRIMHL